MPINDEQQLAENLLARVTASAGIPSVEDWDIELRAALSGDRDFLLIRLGSIAALVNKIVARVNNRALAETNLHESLGRLVRAWEPFRAESPSYTYGVLELIGSYQPMEGFLKIIGFLQHGLHFPEIPFEEGGYGAGADLHAKALIALEYYYPSAPPNWRDDIAFMSYLQVLEQYISEDKYCSYAVGRLIELNALMSDDKRIRLAIDKDLKTIDEIVPVVISSARISKAEQELTNIYTHCFIIGKGAIDHFQDVLNNAGLECQRERDGVRLRLVLPGRRDAIKLDLSQKHVIEVLELGNERGMEGIEDVKTSAAKILENFKWSRN